MIIMGIWNNFLIKPFQVISMDSKKTSPELVQDVRGGSHGS